MCVCVCTCRWKREDIDDLRRYAISCGKASSPIGPGHGDDEEQARGQGQGQGEPPDAQSNAPASADSDSQHGKQGGIVTESDKDSTLRPLSFTTDAKATDNTTLPPLGPSFTPGQPSASSPSVSVSVVKGVECTSEAGRAGPLLSCTPVTVYGSYATPDPPTSTTTSAPAATMQSAFANFYSSSLSAVQTVGQSTRLADWSLTGEAAHSKVSPLLSLHNTGRWATHSYSLCLSLTSFIHAFSHSATCTREDHCFNAHGFEYFQFIRRKIP